MAASWLRPDCVCRCALPLRLPLRPAAAPCRCALRWHTTCDSSDGKCTAHAPCSVTHCALTGRLEEARLGARHFYVSCAAPTGRGSIRLPQNLPDRRRGEIAMNVILPAHAVCSVPCWASCFFRLSCCLPCRLLCCLSCCSALPLAVPFALPAAMPSVLPARPWIMLYAAAVGLLEAMAFLHRLFAYPSMR